MTCGMGAGLLPRMARSPRLASLRQVFARLRRAATRLRLAAPYFATAGQRPARIALCSVALAACSIAPPPPDRFFRIETPAPATAASATFHVQVQAIEAAGLYTERPLVFEREGNGGALEQYHYYFWTEPPDLLLVDALVHYLRAAFGTGQVFGPGGGGTETDFVVRAKLRKLDQRLGDGSASAVLAIQFTIEDAHRKVLGVMDFEESAPAGNGAPAEHVKAIDGLAARAFAQLVARLATMTPTKDGAHS